jgi:cellobiose phosphorylase
LEISPSIPASWDGFTATRKYRDVTYNITVTNPKHVSKGVEKVTVNGKPVEGRVIRAEAGSGAVNVEVVMG